VTNLEVYPHPEDLYQQAAAFFARLAGEAVASRGRFNVALSGGSTPRGVHAVLAQAEVREQIPWLQVHLFWGDERCVLPTHSDSNYRMAEESLISHIPIPAQNVHRILAEQSPEQAAEAYEQTLRECFALSESILPCFDLIFLGMGADGHTASLFPGTAGLREEKRLVIAHYVEKLAAWRITLTAPVLNQAAYVAFLVCGKDKPEALSRVLEGAYEPERFPAQLIRPTNGTLLWLVDEAAASLLGAKEKR
jgi:6-phosphogluconolactonase